MKRTLNPRARLIALVGLVVAAGLVAYLLLGKSSPGATGEPVGPAPTLSVLPSGLPGSATPTAAASVPAGYRDIPLPIATSDPILPYLSAGVHVDILIDQNGNASYVAQDLRVVSVQSVAQAAPAQAPGAAAPLAAATPATPMGNVVVEVPISSETAVLSTVLANPTLIHYAIRGIPPVVVPTPTPTAAPTAKPTAVPTVAATPKPSATPLTTATPTPTH